MRRFNQFCIGLTYFAAFLAEQGLRAKSMKTYLAGIRHLQLALGLPDPCNLSSLPRLRLVLTGIRRVQAESGKTQTRRRLPVTPSILHRIRRLWNKRLTRGEYMYIMPWAALTLCFFGFFRSGELTVPSGKSFDTNIHLSWGDLPINDTCNPQVIKVWLCHLKTDQLGNGVEVVVGRTRDDLRLVAFMVNRGKVPGPFFCFSTVRYSRRQSLWKL